MNRDRFMEDEPSVDHMEHLRRGTFKQYESEWTLIEDTGTHTFTHELGDIPCVVDVSSSEVITGHNPVNVNASVTVTKIVKTITVVSAAGSDLYFRVRAF